MAMDMLCVPFARPSEREREERDSVYVLSMDRVPCNWARRGAILCVHAYARACMQLLDGAIQPFSKARTRVHFYSAICLEQICAAQPERKLAELNALYVVLFACLLEEEFAL